jgi:hypothetical protein
VRDVSIPGRRVNSEAGFLSGGEATLKGCGAGVAMLPE